VLLGAVQFCQRHNVNRSIRRVSLLSRVLEAAVLDVGRANFGAPDSSFDGRFRGRFVASEFKSKFDLKTMSCACGKTA